MKNHVKLPKFSRKIQKFSILCLCKKTKLLDIIGRRLKKIHDFSCKNILKNVNKILGNCFWTKTPRHNLDIILNKTMDERKYLETFRKFYGNKLF